MEVLALADDLTGALETGAKFAARGIEALVAASRGEAGACRVLVVNTETRHLDPATAAARVACAVAANSARLIYKKTDSTLRGNIGAELGALLEAFPDSPLLYVPAYPELGRVVKQGHLYVHGELAHETVFANDALNPVAHSDIARVLRLQTRAPIFSVAVTGLENLKPGAIYICDAESGAEIAAAARVLITSGCRLAAGPAAFADAIAERIRWPRIRSCLVVNGSRHELSLRQVCHAKKSGWRVADADLVSLPDWVILNSSAAAEEMGRIVSGILTRVSPDALAIFGGDTAYGILRSIGSPALRPIGEVVPGVPLSRVDGRAMYWITKAGGFGSEDVLCELRALLS